jgi:hypothetical protein
MKPRLNANAITQIFAVGPTSGLPTRFIKRKFRIRLDLPDTRLEDLADTD